MSGLTAPARPQAPGTSRGFRADIQGLRAVAVGLVALDHASVGPFRGGFVGVDVFFVISGYLITSLLLREVDKTGTLSLKDFYARRARRILPAAMLVLIVTLLASVLLLDGGSALLVGGQAIWATFFMANIKFSRDSTDYFAADDPASPIQHFWSLAVEEQFYLFWPLILLAAFFLLRKRLGNVRRVAVAVLSVAITASLIWSVTLTASDPLSAYFSTPARAWELAIGALAAAATPFLARRLRSTFLAIGSWVGVAMILVASLTFTPQTAFPGYAALLPVLGAALLLLGGIGRLESWGPQGMLSVRPMRLVGDWSYSLYLWHWPLIIIFESLYGPVSGLRGVAILIVATALSAATYTLVETPFRTMRLFTRPTFGRRWSLLLYPATVVLILPSVAVANYVVRAENESGGAAITVSDFSGTGEKLSKDPYVALVEASVLAAQDEQEVPGGLKPSPLELKDSVPDLGECGYFGVEEEDLELCPRGDLDGDKTMILIGDSHARQWIPPLEEIAEDNGYVVYFLVREGCPAVDQTPWRQNGGGPVTQCADFQDWTAETIEELRPDIVLTGTDANENGFTSDEGELVIEDDAVEALVESGMVATLERIMPFAGRTVILGDPPIHEINPIKCLTKQGEPTLSGCLGPPEERSLQMRDAVKRAGETAGAEYLETKQWFCWNGLCPTVVGDYVTHRDREHITIPYALYLGSEIERKLDLADAG